ncbi:MAG: hypothetical protein NTV46_19135 [Verrucomicrobia bacterium]|nr:hypothetical protein [Verrucomicrobiota bacterium]
MDFDEDGSESAEVVNGLLGRIGARGLVVGRDRRVLVLRTTVEARKRNETADGRRFTQIIKELY